MLLIRVADADTIACDCMVTSNIGLRQLGLQRSVQSDLSPLDPELAIKTEGFHAAKTQL